MMAQSVGYVAASKELDDPPVFRTRMVRWVWRTYSQRLTRAGRWLFWPSGVITAYAGASLQIQAYIPFAYILGLWFIAIFAMLIFRPRVRLKVQHAQRICAGEKLPVDIEVEKAGWFRSADVFILPHRLPLMIDAVPDDGAPVPAMRPGEKARVRVSLQCNKRGVYTLRGFRAESDFPFGLLHARRIFERDRALVVYPRFHRLGRLALPTGRRYHPGGVALASNLGESFEFIGDREYRDGDNIRDIDWRATARLCRPIIREYRDEYFLRVAVILDTHVAGSASPAAREAFERAVSLSAAVADYMARQDYLVDIFAAGPKLYHLTAGRALAYLDQILDILACVDENPQEPFEIIEPEIMEGLSKITTVICVFLDWNESRRAFVHRLVQQGAGVKVIIVRDGRCTLDPAADGDVSGEIPVIAPQRVDAGIEDV